MNVIGLGVGRTGTYSFKQALNLLGVGPCHHMEEVLMNQAVQVPLWAAAAQGQPNWQAIYAGYDSAVDWPTAAFFRELYAAYPNAKFVLTVRSPESWVASFSQTIYPFLMGDVNVRAEMRPWSEMVSSVVAKTGFPPGLDEVGLRQAFEAHNAAVKATIPSRQLLVYQVKEGWAPLCDFLGVPVPAEPFPRSNDRSEFWDKVGPALA
jgi:hypothetical protein